LFIKKLTAEKPRLRLFDFINFLPSLITFIYLLPYYLKSREEKVAYLSDFELARKDDFGLLGQITLALVLLYLVLSLLELREYRQKIENTFSEVEQIRLVWLRQFIYALLGILTVASVAFFAQKWNLPVLTAIYRHHIHYFGVVLLIYWIGYKTLSQPRIFTDTPAAKFNNPSVKLTLAPVLTTEPAAENRASAETLPTPVSPKYQKF
jgi:hypothetical protein